MHDCMNRPYNVTRAFAAAGWRVCLHVTHLLSLARGDRLLANLPHMHTTHTRNTPHRCVFEPRAQCARPLSSFNRVLLRPSVSRLVCRAAGDQQQPNQSAELCRGAVHDPSWRVLFHTRPHAIVEPRGSSASRVCSPSVPQVRRKIGAISARRSGRSRTARAANSRTRMMTRGRRRRNSTAWRI